MIDPYLTQPTGLFGIGILKRKILPQIGKAETIFVARFNSNSWSGHLISSKVSDNWGSPKIEGFSMPKMPWERIIVGSKRVGGRDSPNNQKSKNLARAKSRRLPNCPSISPSDRKQKAVKEI